MKKPISHTLLYSVIEAVNRFYGGMYRKRNFDAGASKKHRKSTTTQSSWRPKISPLLHKDVSGLECSQKKLNLIPDMPSEVEFLQSYHDSSVDKVKLISLMKNT